MIKVSVIVPVYNSERFLKECLESLIHQTLQEIEIICIDDKSSDRSCDILQEYQKRDSRLRVIRSEENAGAAAARNQGIVFSSGKYLQFVDADDYLEPDALEELYSTAESCKADMCYLGMAFHRMPNMEGAVIQEGIQGEYPGIYTGKELMKCFMERNEFFLYLCSVFYRGSFVRENGLLYKSLVIGEGGDFILRAMCMAERVTVCRERLYHYRVHGCSVTHSKNAGKELLFGQIVQYTDVLRYLSDHENAEELASSLNGLYKKMAGGLQNLSRQDKEEIRNRLETAFERHIFDMLRNENQVYGIKFDEKILAEIRKKELVIVYGAGYASKEIIELLQEYNIEIVGFAVTKRKEGQKSLYGHHIYEITELLPYRKKAVVLIAANRKYNREIQSILEYYAFDTYLFLNVEI